MKHDFTKPLSPAERMLVMHPSVPMGPQTLDEFHEWSVEFALEKFRAKPSNDHPINFFNLRRPSAIMILEPRCETEREKHAVMLAVRELCAEPEADTGLRMISSINEIWIAVTTSKEEFEQYGAVRNMPQREDGLMVATYDRDGDRRVTRWIVKLKANPANNRILARDDVHGDDVMGIGADYFKPLREE